MSLYCLLPFLPSPLCLCLWRMSDPSRPPSPPGAAEHTTAHILLLPIPRNTEDNGSLAWTIINTWLRELWHKRKLHIFHRC